MRLTKLPKPAPPSKTDQLATIPKTALEIYLPPNTDAVFREAYMSARPAVIAGFGILAFFFSSIFIWVVYVPLRAEIHATGELVFKSKRQTVQHLEGGIVKEILVHDGDMVQAGQPLIKLESSQVQPLVNMLDEQGLAEIAYMARVEAESRDLPSIHFPGSITAHAKEPSVSRIMQAEERLFAARRVSFHNQVQLINLQIAQLRESSKGTQERLATKKQEIALLKQQLDANQALQSQGYVTNSTVLDYQRALAAQTGEYNLIAASIASERQRKIEMEQRIFALRAERIQSAINEMKQSSLRTIDQQEKIRPLRDTLQRQVIRAPVSGKVVALKIATVGGTIMPRDTLLEIAPTTDHLVLEAKIRLEDITEVKVGQQADIAISGIHPRARPDVKGRITYISDDRIMGQPPYYAAMLDLDKESLKTLGGAELRPGMSAAVSIATKPRTPFIDMMDTIREHFFKSRATR